jgi:hypothetical protein
VDLYIHSPIRLHSAQTTLPFAFSDADRKENDMSLLASLFRLSGTRGIHVQTDTQQHDLINLLFSFKIKEIGKKKAKRKYWSARLCRVRVRSSFSRPFYSRMQLSAARVEGVRVMTS